MLDNVPDIADLDARSHNLDAFAHAFIGGINQFLYMLRSIADDEHLAGIPMETILDHGDINIDDIAIFQFLVPGYAVTDLVVDRGTDRFREATVIQRGRDGLLLVDDVIVTQLVEFVCCLW